MSSQSLSVEQRKKIEDNRQKALARRDKKILRGSVTGCVDQRSKCQALNFDKHHFNSNDVKKKNPGYQQSQNCRDIGASCSAPTSRPHFPTHQSLSQSKGNSSTTINKNVKAAQFNTTSSAGAIDISSTNQSRPSAPLLAKEKFYGLPAKVINGKCVLISRDRFSIDVLYHGPLIEYFKQMETRNYDTSSRIWSFQLREYDKFMKGVKSFQPDVVIEPLPSIIVQTFCHSATDNGVEQVDLSRIDADLVKTLMPFQTEGVYFALHHDGRILLADEMGLGKTLQALSIASYYRSEWPLLIVTPSSVRFDWAQQICKWLPSVDPQDVNVVDSGKGNVKEGLVCVISYDLMPKKIVHLKERQFKVIIMDESHFLKNSKAIRTKAAAAISKMAKRIIMLSGTPALSRPSELFTQISSVCPSMFKFHDFGVRYCAAKQQPWGWDYSGSSNLQELQLLLEKKVMIRRQKSDVLQQLPDKTRQVVILNPVLVSSTKDLNRASKIMDKASLKGMERRGALLQYFHETCKAKLKAVKDFILDLIESDKKFLVFAHHQEMMDCIEDAILENTKIKYIRIDGSTKSEQRSLLCKKLQTQEDYRVALLSITAANAGLNLSAANLVIFAELFWNPGILVQAEDRVHRIGQKNSVSVQYLMARKTADDYIWPLIQDKLTILTKAGLTKDRFSDADTKHVMDTSQSTILEMFKRDFIDDSSLTLSESNQESLPSTPPCQTTPQKLKRRRSLSQSPTSKFNFTSSPESPRNRQLRITKFLRTSDGGKSLSVTSQDSKDPVKKHSPIKECTAVQKCKKELCDRNEGFDDSDTDLLEMDNEVCPESSSSGTNRNLVTPAVLSLEDCEALNDMSWDEDFWS